MLPPGGSELYFEFLKMFSVPENLTAPGGGKVCHLLQEMLLAANDLLAPTRRSGVAPSRVGRPKTRIGNY